MKVLALHADVSGCFQYRVRLPAEAAQRRGVDITYAPDIEVEATRNSVTGIVTVSEVKTDADVLILQRPSTQRMNAVAECAKRQGIAVVADIDDDLAMLPKHNAAYRKLDPERNRLENWRWLQQTATTADWVTVSTNLLLRYGDRDRSSVVYNAVDPAWLEIEPKRPETLGWMGTPSVHAADLYAIRGGLLGLEERASLHLITEDPRVVAKSLGWAGDVTAASWQGFEHYPHEIANKIGVGLVPLDNSDLFNHAKSFLKGIEFAALGIPFVASVTPQYTLLSNGYSIGGLAKGPAQWKRLLTAALDNRDRIGDTYRTRISHGFTTEHTVASWILAWQRALDQAKARQGVSA